MDTSRNQQMEHYTGKITIIISERLRLNSDGNTRSMFICGYIEITLCVSINNRLHVNVFKAIDQAAK